MPDDPKDTPPQAAADKPPSDEQAEPLKGEVSRTDSPGAGASAAPTPTPKPEPAPTPVNPAAASTAVTSETSSVLDKPTAPAAESVAKAGAAAASGAGTATPAGAPKAAPGAVAATPGAAAKAAHDTKPAPPAGPPDPPPPAGTEVPSFITALQSALPGAVTQLSFWVGDWTMIVPASRLLDVAQFLRDTPETAFDFCSDVTASDWPTRPQRFDVVYCLYSTRHRRRVRLKVRAAESEGVPSVSRIWPSANWLEREVYDLFGVNFTGHPDRRRILMPEDWQGFPQRKDYPLEGPGELLMENPLDWLKLRQAREDAEIE
jgi:NADH/F420H2 dehydrogenase subunit C